MPWQDDKLAQQKMERNKRVKDAAPQKNFFPPKLKDAFESETVNKLKRGKAD